MESLSKLNRRGLVKLGAISVLVSRARAQDAGAEAEDQEGREGGEHLPFLAALEEGEDDSVGHPATRPRSERETFRSAWRAAAAVSASPEASWLELQASAPVRRGRPAASPCDARRGRSRIPPG